MTQMLMEWRGILRAKRRVSVFSSRILLATNILHQDSAFRAKWHGSCLSIDVEWNRNRRSAKVKYSMKPITPENNEIGFIGIGYMGRPIAQRLLEAGFKLTAYDQDRSKAEKLVRYGGTVAASVAELSSSCSVVLSCLPNDEAVLDIYRGPDGVFANAHRGSRVIDLSTVYPETSQELSRLGSEHGVEVLDVTISGSTPVAENGLLTLFGGGNKECFDAAESIFRVIAKTFLSRAERVRSDDEACGEHFIGNRNASDCRSRRAW